MAAADQPPPRTNVVDGSSAIEPILVAATLLAVAEAVEPLASVRRLTLLAPSGDLRLKARVDARLLGQVLAALLGAAIHHSSAGGLVRMRLDRRGDRVGIEIEHQERVPPGATGAPDADTTAAVQAMGGSLERVAGHAAGHAAGHCQRLELPAAP